MQTDKNIRRSNFELLRIILTLSVIAHHYVVNSGVMDSFNYHQISPQMVYLQFFGAFGKIAINAFVLITGYFMCTGTFSWKKWLKLYVQIKFYRIAFYLLFLLTGHSTFDYHVLLETLFSTVFLFGTDYAETYLGLYLLVPWMNKLVDALTRKEHLRLLGILLTIFTLFSSFSIFLSVKHASNDTWNYLGWMVTLYLIGAYLRRYPLPRILVGRNAWLLFAGNCILIFLSILCVDFIGIRVDFGAQYWFVNDANKLLALTTAVSLFCWFLQMEMPHIPAVNRIASTAFGVYLIHTVHPTMRQWLWTDALAVREVYDSGSPVLHSIVSVLAIFCICTLIEAVRVRLMDHILSQNPHHPKQYS